MNSQDAYDILNRADRCSLGDRLRAAALILSNGMVGAGALAAQSRMAQGIGFIAEALAVREANLDLAARLDELRRREFPGLDAADRELLHAIDRALRGSIDPWREAKT